MSEFEDNKELVAQLKELGRQVEAADNMEEKMALSKKAMSLLADSGHTVDYQQLEFLADFSAKMVEGFLDSILAVADQMESDTIPVGFLRQLRAQCGSIVSQMMVKATDAVGVPIDYGVPDDISELLGEA
jgi:hypothetical protein